MSDLLLENYLASQFKFGFELEAFKKDGWINYTPKTSHWEDDQPIEDDDYSDNSYNEYSSEEAKEVVKREIEKSFKLKDITIKSDGSLEPDGNDD